MPIRFTTHGYYRGYATGGSGGGAADVKQYSSEMDYLGFYYYGYLGVTPTGGRKGGPDKRMARDDYVPYVAHPVRRAFGQLC